MSLSTLQKRPYVDFLADYLDLPEDMAIYLMGTSLKTTSVVQILDEAGVFSSFLKSDRKRPEKLSNRRLLYSGTHRGFAIQLMEELSETQFARMFRLSRVAFNELLAKLNVLEKRNGLKYVHDDSVIIPAKLRLAITLRWLAGGSYHDICFAFGVHEGSFFRVLWECIDAIDDVFTINFPIEDRAELGKLAEGFSRFSKGHLTHCVMAMDGWVCRTRMPRKDEVPNQICFRNRKGFWGLVVFAGCDSDLRFTMLSTRCPGSTNDSLAWELTNVYQELMINKNCPVIFM